MTDPLIQRYLLPPPIPGYQRVGLHVLRLSCRLFAAWAVIGGAIGIAVYLASPSSYRSRASFLVDQRSAARGQSGAFGVLANELGMGIGGGGAGPQYFADLLRSRTVQTAVTRRFVPGGQDSVVLSMALGTTKRSEAGTDEASMAALDRSLSVSANPRTSVVSLDVVARDPRQAAAIAGLLIEELDRFLLGKRQSSARAQSLFLSRRIQEAEDSLKRIEAAEVRFVQVNREYRGSAQLSLLFQQLQRRSLSALQLVSSLQAQLESSRLAEVNDTPQLTVLDAPVPPVSRSAPRLSRTVAAGVLLGFLVAAVLLATKLGPTTPAGSPGDE